MNYNRYLEGTACGINYHWYDTEANLDTAMVSLGVQVQLDNHGLSKMRS